MENLNIKYEFTIYNYEENKIIKIENLQQSVGSEILFPEMIENLVKKNNINCFQIYVENLKTNTWGKYFNDDVLMFMDGDDYHYKWFNYKVGDIQDKFKLFDNVINIVIDGPGIGGLLDDEEGIKFYINNNEKERHEFEPHVHCTYSGEKMRIRIDTLEIMKKDKPFKNRRKTQIALEWVEKNQDALIKYYNAFAIKGESDITFEANI